VKAWDFNWQDEYLYRKPVTLPKGTKVKMESVHDNSGSNPANPNSPPKRIKWGEGTQDEMSLCVFEATCDSIPDLLRLVADWLPVAAALYAYVVVRGVADQIGVGTNYTWAPRVDRALTGVIPTVWLQSHMYAAGYDHWWNALLTGVYDSHFVMTPLILAWLWGRRPERFYAYRRRLLGLTFVALAFFIVHPTAPPWLAAHHHVIDPSVRRTDRLGTTALHLHRSPHWFDSGARLLDEVAAFPSLHAGLTVLPLICLWQQAKPWARVALVGYPMAMAFTIIATGDHWLVDVLAAWLLAFLVHRAALAYEQWVSRRHIERVVVRHPQTDVPTPTPTPMPAGVQWTLDERRLDRDTP